jgi:hypothetical protein
VFVDTTFAIAAALKGVVVTNHKLIILSWLNIYFNPFQAEFSGLFNACFGIFWVSTCYTPMTYDDRRHN